MSKIVKLSFAQELAALCGDKNEQNNLRLSIIGNGAAVAVRGNATPWKEGAAAVLKMRQSTVRNALVAGFDAVGKLSPLFKPQVKATMAAADVEEQETARIEAVLELFEDAYNAALPVPKTKEERKAAKEEKKAAAATAQAAAVEAEIAARGLVSADAVATDGEIFSAFLARLQAGRFKQSTAMIDELKEALGVPAMLKQAHADGFAQAKAAAIQTAAAAPKAKTAAPKAKTAPRATVAPIEPSAPAAPHTGAMAPATVKVDGKTNMVPSAA